MRLLAGTKLPDWPHLLWNPRQQLRERHGPHGLVLLFDVVQEMQMISAAQDDHLPARRSSGEQLVHPIEARHDVVLRDQIQGGNVAPPVESERAWQNSRPR